MQSYLDSSNVIVAEDVTPMRAASPAMSVLPVFGSAVRQPAPADHGRTATMVSAPAHPFHGEPKVEAIEANGVIQKIIVTCGCGERIEVHCGY